MFQISLLPKWNPRIQLGEAAVAHYMQMAWYMVFFMAVETIYALSIRQFMPHNC